MGKDIPIIFSGPMVRALLEGRKTMTRRVLNHLRIAALPESSAYTLTGDGAARALIEAADFRNIDGNLWVWSAKAFDHQAPATRTHWHARIRYAVGDRLWVRETVACGACAPSKPSTWSPSFWRREQGTSDNRNGIWYQADGLSPQAPITERGRWVPSIHMPRWCSRLTLIVKAVKIERVQDISLTDVCAEGCEVRQFWLFGADGPMRQQIGAGVFSHLWTDIHGDESWKANPFVVAISFRVIKANIDAPEARIAA